MPKVPFWIFIILAVLYLSAYRVDMMDIDATQYAEISREMMQSKSYLQVYDRGMEYLDKPPFLFWVSSISMGIFGVNNFGYKLPSILFALWAIYATYRLAKLLYGEHTGRWAALILGTCQGMFLMTNDIRTDTILMSWVVTAIWMIKEAEQRRKWYYVLGGTFSIACGMMTKGPIALFVPVFCFLSDWILKREWKQLFNIRHLQDALLIVIFLIPMSIGLYQQFDMHPEKTVNGLTNVSGLRFFYWSQSFGRITGESPWNNGAGFDFLLSNMLWSFQPWIFIFIAALIISVVNLARQRFRLLPHQEWITAGGFILTYISLGVSKYQLPHYIFVVFPLAAIMTARLLEDMYVHKMHQKLYHVLRPVQMGIAALILVASLLTLIYVFPAGITGICIWLLAAAVWLYVVIPKGNKHRMVWASVTAIIIANVFLTHHFYYQLLQYQVGSQAGKYITQHNIAPQDMVAYKVNDPLTAWHFYSRAIMSVDTTKLSSGKYVLTTDAGLPQLQQKGYSYQILKKGSYFKVSELTPQFLNPATRRNATTDYYILMLQ